jgi:hypothetical protein
LLYTKVLELNRVTKLYKLGFRDGLTFELSGPQLDRASVVEEHILAESEVSIDVDGDEPKLVVFKAAHIKEAKVEQGRYKTTGPEMATPGPFGSDFSADTDSSGEDSESSTASVHVQAVRNKKSRGSLGGTKIAGTPDETTDRAVAKQLVGANGSLESDVKGNMYVHAPLLLTQVPHLYTSFIPPMYTSTSQGAEQGQEAENATKALKHTKANDSQDFSSSEDDDDFTHAFVEPLPADANKQAYIDAVGMPGQLLCFLRLYNGEPVFGILASDVDEARLFGTCIMHDGEYQTLSCHLLGQAAARCKERKYLELCPRVDLLSLLLERNKDLRAMKHDIKMVESDYKIALRKAAKKLKVANAAAQKQKEHAAAIEEKQNVDAAAHMREASPTPPPQNDNQTSQPGEAVEPHPDKRNSPIPCGLDAQNHISHKTTLVNEITTLQHLDKGPTVS